MSKLVAVFYSSLRRGRGRGLADRGSDSLNPILVSDSPFYPPRQLSCVPPSSWSLSRHSSPISVSPFLLRRQLGFVTTSSVSVSPISEFYDSEFLFLYDSGTKNV
ncbi:hypothetical protein S83_035205 [Arachis hypogaea]|nr:uncharacterized protein DS421_11g330220 [Arachis hypogaea]